MDSPITTERQVIGESDLRALEEAKAAEAAAAPRSRARKQDGARASSETPAPDADDQSTAPGEGTS